MELFDTELTVTNAVQIHQYARAFAGFWQASIGMKIELSNCLQEDN